LRGQWVVGQERFPEALKRGGHQNSFSDGLEDGWDVEYFRYLCKVGRVMKKYTSLGGTNGQGKLRLIIHQDSDAIIRVEATLYRL
jgi:hypothetical protein